MIEHKKGDTFEVTCTYENDAGAPVSLDGITITSQLRTPAGALVADCTATVTSVPNGTFTLLVADTSSWPVAKLEFDVQYALTGGRIISSETVNVHVVKDVTR